MGFPQRRRGRKWLQWCADEPSRSGRRYRERELRHRKRVLRFFVPKRGFSGRPSEPRATIAQSAGACGAVHFDLRTDLICQSDRWGRTSSCCTAVQTVSREVEGTSTHNDGEHRPILLTRSVQLAPDPIRVVWPRRSSGSMMFLEDLSASRPSSSADLSPGGAGAFDRS